MQLEIDSTCSYQDLFNQCEERAEMRHIDPTGKWPDQAYCAEHGVRVLCEESAGALRAARDITDSVQRA